MLRMKRRSFISGSSLLSFAISLERTIFRSWSARSGSMPRSQCPNSATGARTSCRQKHPHLRRKSPTPRTRSSNRRIPNRLYLIHHRELPFAETTRIFRDWRKACPASIEIIPALVLRMYDKAADTGLFAAELDELLTFFKAEIHPAKIAVYDVLPKRDQGAALATLAKNYPQGLMRIGLQPDEPLDAPFSGAVEDTWSGFCHGLTNDDWQDRGFGRDTLRKWVSLRNEQAKRIAYDLIVVAWDYANTKRGEYPGYDDAHKNLPLPAERNRLAAREILALAKPEAFAGFSADLLIIELNSETAVTMAATRFTRHSRPAETTRATMRSRGRRCVKFFTHWARFRDQRQSEVGAMKRHLPRSHVRYDPQACSDFIPARLLSSTRRMRRLCSCAACGRCFRRNASPVMGTTKRRSKADYDMRTLESAIKGGESEVKAIVPGKPEESPLYLASTRQHDDWEPMPPKEADKLKPEQLAWIKEWIAVVHHGRMRRNETPSPKPARTSGARRMASR
jgi:hypothetical protein